jgi:hypothetical protein
MFIAVVLSLASSGLIGQMAVAASECAWWVLEAPVVPLPALRSLRLGMLLLLWMKQYNLAAFGQLWRQLFWQIRKDHK